MSSGPAQLRSQIAAHKRRISFLDRLIDRKFDHHDAMLAQVNYSKEYEAVFKAQLERTLSPLWDEIDELTEKIQKLKEELAALGG